MLLPSGQLHPRSVINGSNVLAHIEEAAPSPESLPSAMTHGQRPMTHDLDLGELGPHLTTSPGSPAHQQPCTLQLFGHQTWGGLNLLRIDHGWLVMSVIQSVSQSVLTQTYSRRGTLSHAWHGATRYGLLRPVSCVLCCVRACGLSAIRVRGHPARIHPASNVAHPASPSRPNEHACLAISVFPISGRARSPSTDLTDRMGSL